ncbi:hypothetical protein GCM10009827_120110 [Dactylosporangium maewongense]|uniref:Methyl-accepting chemotaxis protein n=1 Tax=Dactylosporangium maewongense TaxID=634393 RepID=A0ABP4PJT8_9ACTN
MANGVAGGDDATTGRGGWFGNRGVAVKIGFLVAFSVLTAVTVALTAVVQLGNLRGNVSALSDHNIARLTHLSDVQKAFSQMLLNALARNQATDPAVVKQAQAGFQESIGAVNAAFEAYAGVPDPDAQQRRLTEQFRTNWTEFQTVLGQLAAVAPTDPVVQTIGMHANQMTEQAQDIIVELAGYEQNTARQMVEQAHETYSSALRALIAALVAGLLVAALVAYLVIRQIVRPLREMRAVALAMAEGDLTQRAPVRFRDEVGDTAHALNTGTRHIREAIHTLLGSAQRLATSGDHMAANSSEISVGATEASREAAAVSGAAGDVSSNIQTLADGSHQMRTSIEEISRSASEGVAVAAEAVHVATTTTGIVTKLGESSVQIGNVIKTITAIAEQTNLLALNATIEAARAGESGKGFAVVAGEVKDLAQETARATDDIARQVQAIQSDTQSAVAAISQIGAIIERINSYQMTVATAVEEQTATTDEMNRNVMAAAQGSMIIARNISTVATATERTMRGAADNSRAANELAEMSQELRAVVAQFKV